MKNKILLILALLLIAVGLFLGIGIRTKSNIIEKPVELSLTENR